MSKARKYKPIPNTLPCPFCGAHAIGIKEDECPPEMETPWFVVCCSRDTVYHHRRGTGCHASVMAIGDTLDQAVARWNTRA